MCLIITTPYIYLNNSLLSSFQFNQIAINKWDLNLKYTTNSNEQFLFIGLESRSLKASNLLVNYKLFQNHILNFTYNLSNDKSTSENFINKRFELEIDFLQFGYKYNLSNTFQTSFYYKIQNKNNIQGEESLKWNELNGEIRYNDLDKTSITASTSYIKTDFSGNNSTLVANQMLEGFKAGNSFLWRLALQRNLTNYLQLNFNYEGRKNEDNPVIHIGNVQLRANF